jgi:polyhydroxyalkanoate synthesis regulator phasin
MKPEDKTGFLFQQSFLLRLVFISFLYLIGIVVTRFLIPIDLATISIFASMIVGTLVGTYLANMIFKSGEVIDEKGDSITDLVKDTIDKGKDLIEDVKSSKEESTKEVEESINDSAEDVIEDTRSARERLKDKGLM